MSPATQLMRQMQRPTHTRSNTNGLDKASFKVLFWNAGGLSLDKFSELKTIFTSVLNCWRASPSCCHRVLNCMQYSIADRQTFFPNVQSRDQNPVGEPLEHSGVCPELLPAARLSVILPRTVQPFAEAAALNCTKLIGPRWSYIEGWAVWFVVRLRTQFSGLHFLAYTFPRPLFCFWTYCSIAPIFLSSSTTSDLLFLFSSWTFVFFLPDLVCFVFGFFSYLIYFFLYRVLALFYFFHFVLALFHLSFHFVLALFHLFSHFLNQCN